MKPNLYRRMADQIHPDPALIARTAALLRSRNQPRRPPRAKRALPAAAAMLALLVAGTAAAGYLSPASPLAGFLQRRAAFFESVFWSESDGASADRLAGGAVQPYSLSMTGNGYTFTLENNLYDAATEMGVAELTVTNPDGLDGFGETRGKSYLHTAVFPEEIRLYACVTADGKRPRFRSLFGLRRPQYVSTQECINMEKSTEDRVRLSVCYMLEPDPRKKRDAAQEPVLWLFLVDAKRETADSLNDAYKGTSAYLLEECLAIPLSSELSSRTLSDENGNPLLTVSPLGILQQPASSPDEGSGDTNYIEIQFRSGETYVVMDETRDDLTVDRNGDTYNSPACFTTNYIYRCGFHAAQPQGLLSGGGSDGMVWKTMFDRIVDPDEIVSITIQDRTFSFSE